MDVVALQRSKHYIEGLNKMNQGAAVGVGPGEQPGHSKQMAHPWYDSAGKESAYNAMQETWVQSLGWEDSLEKGTVTHSRILAWRIPWTV